jgi:hypothetical protein
MQAIGIWGLREEARKSWDHVVSDKVVYLAEPIQRDLEIVGFTKKYLNRDLWVEVHLTLPDEGERERHFQVICEAVDPVSAYGLPVLDTESKVKHIRQRWNGSMFVEIPELIQLPEQIISKNIFSEVRLKRIQNSCHCGWVQSAPIVVCPRISENGEANTPLLVLGEGSARVEMSQSPCELIERRPQATNEIAEQHRDYFRSGSNVDLDDVESMVKIGLLSDGIWLHGPLPDRFLKRLEVFVRPTGLHLYEYQMVGSGNGHAGSLAECGQASI